ncbi:hypothetical protein [Clostridium sp. C105KSO13]|uniref:hypothetical protein n=1 Tax=Clostridium sp. C105KSO13 TaxID=1776045 RepID=UPI0007406D00|nr:hypothetical protein [Clostridium sp. C105KSO13]CUX28315.1 hypothetical protein BN3456_01071 [Clostridium sp. C105KSO13]
MDESFVPQDIKDKIVELNALIKKAEVLSKEVTKWYHEALLEMDLTLDVEDELFDATNLLCVEGIDFNSIMEGLSTVQIFRSSYKDKALN